MTQDEIIEMAKQSGAVSGKPTPDSPEIVFTQCLDIYHFAKLVAAKEREALTPRCWTTKMNDAWNKAIPDLTLAFDELIRARGEA
jgi:hypothetical protein